MIRALSFPSHRDVAASTRTGVRVGASSGRARCRHTLLEPRMGGRRVAAQVLHDLQKCIWRLYLPLDLRGHCAAGNEHSLSSYDFIDELAAV